MRTFAFTLLAVALAMASHWLLEYWEPPTMTDAIHNIVYVLHLLLPMIATAGLAYAMRISNLGLVIVLTVFSPFVSWVLMLFTAVYVFNERIYL